MQRIQEHGHAANAPTRNLSRKKPSPNSPEYQKKAQRQSLKVLLKIMQWNACNISTKIAELTHVLSKEDVDVLLVQETHLSPEEASPSISGFESYRGRDRTEMSKGGIITYIRNTVTFERLAKNRQHGTEVSTVCVKLSRNKWVKLTNLYCRPPRFSRRRGSQI